MENNRKHYRVAKKEIYEDPYEGVYVTKEEQKICFLITMAAVAVGMLVSLFVALKDD